MNSGINPLLYAFLSRNFRRGMRELFNYCSMKRTTSAMSQHQRAPVHVSKSCYIKDAKKPEPQVHISVSCEI